jgi:hypothetical protein
MSESRKTIFISCGQFTARERELGQKVRALVEDLTPFEGYFAQDQSSLESLTSNILHRLHKSVGLIVIMHHRGKIEGRDINRASVWVEQEVAIAAFMEEVLGRRLHAVLFNEEGISLEGLRKYIIFNAKSFSNDEDVLQKLKTILPTWKEPKYLDDQESQKLVDAAKLSVEAQTGMNTSFTILVWNHSDYPFAIETIELFSKKNELCKPIFKPNNSNWTVLPQGSLPINFMTDRDVSQRLTGIHGHFFTTNQFHVDIVIEVQGKMLGMTKKVKGTRTVQVNTRGHQITPIL